MTQNEFVLLDRVFQSAVPVERVGAQVRQVLNIEAEYLHLMECFACEKARLELYGRGPHDQAAYEHQVRPILRAITQLLARINNWLTVSLLEAKWVGFGIRVPMEVDPKHTPLLPRWWMLLKVDFARGFAEGGGLRYERLYVSDLSQLSPEEAAKVPALLERYAQRLCARGSAGSRKKMRTAVNPKSIGKEIAAAFEQAVDRRLQGMIGATGALPVALTEISSQALMRVQVAAMELPPRATAERVGTAAPKLGEEDRPRRRPGRPSMRGRLRDQMFVRAQKGLVADGVGEEARQLRAWAIENRQDGDPPVPLPESIGNGIRRHYARALEVSNGIKSLMAKNN